MIVGQDCPLELLDLDLSVFGEGIVLADKGKVVKGMHIVVKALFYLLLVGIHRLPHCLPVYEQQEGR